jgi:predicted nucleotide-binding protein (sugar kinase/HSP70/actin superfamily)
MLKKALVNAGFDSVPVVSVTTSSPLSEQPGFSPNRIQMILLFFFSILYTGSILNMFFITAAREKNKGESLSLVKKYFAIGRKMMGKYDIGNREKWIAKAVREFNQIGVHEGPFPRIGVVGEIYMKENPFGNKAVPEWIVEQGIEVVVPSILSFFMECFVDVQMNGQYYLDTHNILGREGYFLVQQFADWHIRRVNRIMKGFRYPVFPFHSIYELSKKAKKVLSLANRSGEGWILPGEVVALSEWGVNHIVCLQPFACIANHIVAKGMEKRFKRLHPNLRLLFLDMDASDSEVNIFNRLQFMIKNAKC